MQTDYLISRLPISKLRFYCADVLCESLATWSLQPGVLDLSRQQTCRSFCREPSTGSIARYRLDRRVLDRTGNTASM